MKISTNTIRFVNEHYNSAGDPAAMGIDDLATKIGAQLGGIDETIEYGARYEGAYIVRIVTCQKHPGADKLTICLIDDGGAVDGVERDDHGLVRVVCGAPNVRDGLMVVWLPPGSTVPESIGDGKEPFVLTARELRGVVSNGMLASAREMALGDNHDGILEINTDKDEAIACGTPFVEAYHLRDDTIFDIENKMFTHRPDCFGFMGVAREIEGIYHRPYKSPEWYRTDAPLPEVETEPLALEVHNQIPELAPRFTAIVLAGVTIKPSPLWLQIDLAKHGVKSINNIVDYTNFFMLETGQPIHAYDYDKVKAMSGDEPAVLEVRKPQPGEQIKLLNGKTITPRADAMMVASGQHLLCVGGAIGGSDTEVDDTTTNLIIEAATWDMYSMRRTSMEHGIFTDAVTRFTKGQSPLQNRAVIAKIVDEIRRFADGKVASELIDIKTPAVDDALRLGTLHAPVSVDVDFINSRLGLTLSTQIMTELLTNVEFDVVISRQSDGDCLIVKAPFWRTDIEIPEDVVEEVGRLYGFDRLPLELPLRPMAPVAKKPMLELKQLLRSALRDAGANELLTYSFVHGKLLDAAGQERQDSYQLSNALSPDLQYYRQSLTPSLLDKVHANIKAGYGEFALFEIGRGHVKDVTDNEGLPEEFERLALVYAADERSKPALGGAAYYTAKKYLEVLLQRVGIDRAIFAALQPDEYLGSTKTKISQYETGRSALVRVGDRVIGEIGEYKSSVRKALKLPDYCAGFELDLIAIAAHRRQHQDYQPLSRFPKVEQDICLKLPSSVNYSDVYELVASVIKANQPKASYATLTPVDIYQRDQDTEHKQITLRLSITSSLKTLRDAEVTSLLDIVTQSAADRFGAERI